MKFSPRLAAGLVVLVVLIGSAIWAVVAAVTGQSLAAGSESTATAVLIVALLAAAGAVAAALAALQDQEQTARALAEERSLLAGLVESLPMPAFVKDSRLAYRYVNRPYAEALGLAPEGLIGKTDDLVLPAELAEQHRAGDERVLTTGEPETVLERTLHEREDRRLRLFRAPIRGAQGIAGLAGLVPDAITPALHEGDAAESESLHAALSAVVRLECAGRQFTFRLDERTAGYTPEEATVWASFRPPGELAAAGEPGRETPVLPAEAAGALELPADSGTAASSEEARWMATLLEAFPQLVWAADPDGRITYCNQHWFDNTDPEEDAGEPLDWSRAIHPEDLPRWNERWEQARQTGEGFAFEGRLRTAIDGSYRWYLGQAAPARTDDWQVARWYGTFTDIDMRKRAEESLEAWTHAQAELLELGLLALTCQDLATVMETATALIARGLDVERCEVWELLSDGGALLRSGRGLPFGTAGGEIASVRADSFTGAILKAGDPVLVEDFAAESRFDGTSLAAEGVASGLGMSIAGRERPFGALFVLSREPRVWTPDEVRFFQFVVRTLSAAVMRRSGDDAVRERDARRFFAERMEAVGRLAGALARTYGELASRVSREVDSVLESLHAGDPRRPAALRAKEASDEAQVLSRQLRMVGGTEAGEPTRLDLNEVLLNMERLLKQHLGGGVQLSTDLVPGAVTLSADVARVETAILHLCSFVRQRTPAGGTILLETRVAEFQEPRAVLHGELPAGPYVSLRVKGTGFSLSRESLTHLFEPYYVPPEGGDNFGPDLAVAYGLVRQVGGAIEAETVPGHGTTFQLFFPRAHATEAEASEEAEAAATLLLVHEEGTVRSSLAALLRSSGYAVLEAAHNHDALQLCERHPRALDLVLVDLAPSNPAAMSGPELAGRARTLRPGVKVLLMCDPAQIPATPDPDDPTEYLEKPFSPGELISRVQEVLESRTASGLGD